MSPLFLSLLVGCMTLERTGQCELAKLVADHVFRDIHRNVLMAVMDGDRQTDEIREDRRATRPGFDRLLIPRSAAASTFFSKWASQNGPFFTERAIAYSLTLVTALDDHARRALVAAGAITLSRRAPRAHRIATCSRLAFTTAVRVIDRVHCNATHRRADTAPAVRASLTDLTEAMLFVANFTNRRAAFNVNAADFTGAQADLCVDAFTSQQHRRRTSRTRHLRALARQHFDAVDRRTDRNVADRQRVTSTDRRFGTGHQLLTDGDTLRSNDVTAFAVCVQNQRDVRATVRIVLKTLDLRRDTVLIATEIDDTIVMLVTTTLDDAW